MGAARVRALGQGGKQWSHPHAEESPGGVCDPRGPACSTRKASSELLGCGHPVQRQKGEGAGARGWGRGGSEGFWGHNVRLAGWMDFWRQMVALVLQRGVYHATQKQLKWQTFCSCVYFTTIERRWNPLLSYSIFRFLCGDLAMIWLWCLLKSLSLFKQRESPLFCVNCGGNP